MSPELPGNGPGLSRPVDVEPVECPLLLTRQQLAALEAVAHDQGITAGQMLRRLVVDFCVSQVPRDNLLQPSGSGRSDPSGLR